jgi:hypothetical protein
MYNLMHYLSISIRIHDPKLSSHNFQVLRCWYVCNCLKKKVDTLQSMQVYGGAGV